LLDEVLLLLLLDLLTTTVLLEEELFTPVVFLAVEPLPLLVVVEVFLPAVFEFVEFLVDEILLLVIGVLEELLLGEATVLRLTVLFVLLEEFPDTVLLVVDAVLLLFKDELLPLLNVTDLLELNLLFL
jgi:hypothetical protein